MNSEDITPQHPIVKWFYKELTSWIRKTAIIIKVPTPLLDWLICGIKPNVNLKEFNVDPGKATKLLYYYSFWILGFTSPMPDEKLRKWENLLRQKWKEKERIGIWRLRNLLTDPNYVYHDPTYCTSCKDFYRTLANFDTMYWAIVTGRNLDIVASHDQKSFEWFSTTTTYRKNIIF